MYKSFSTMILLDVWVGTEWVAGQFQITVYIRDLELRTEEMVESRGSRKMSHLICTLFLNQISIFIECMFS
jgi:hypothetical protein